MNAWLEAKDGLNVPVRGVCSIGRHATNTIVITDHKVSRRHALIHSPAPDIFQVVDLGSSNGVAVNGQRVKEPVDLKDGDQIEIADNRFVFRLEQASATPDDGENTIFMAFKDLGSTPVWLLVAQIQEGGDSGASTEARAQQAGLWLLGSHELVEKHGGVINRYLGDGFLAYWPDKGTDPKTVAAAVNDFKALQLSGKPPFRFALHHAPVKLDKSASGGGDVLLGPAVTVALQLERLAASLKIERAFSEPAATLLTSLIELEAIGIKEFPNNAGTHPVFTSK